MSGMSTDLAMQKLRNSTPRLTRHSFMLLLTANSPYQTMLLFFRDMIKGILLAVVFGPPIVAAIIIIVQKGGPYLAIYLWGFMLIFNKFTPAKRDACGVDECRLMQ